MYLIRVGVQLKRLPDNSLDVDTKSAPAKSLRTFLTPTRSRCSVFNQPKAIHGRIAHSHTKAKGITVKSKNTKESFRNFFLEGKTPTWTRMDVDFASTIRSISAQMLLMGLSVPKGGTYAVARAVLPLMRRRTMTRRSDARAASAHWLVLVRISQIA